MNVYQLSSTVKSSHPQILLRPWIQEYFFKFPLQGLHPQILSGPYIHISLKFPYKACIYRFYQDHRYMNKYFQLSFTVQSLHPLILSGPSIQEYFVKFRLQGLHPGILL